MSGSRGPLTAVSSRRGELARRKEKNEGDTIITAPEMPNWIPISARDLWETTLNDLEEACIPLERIDGAAIGFYVLCIVQAREAAAQKDLKLSARLNRDAIAWATQIGGTPAARARLGIKPRQKKKPSKWDEPNF